MPVPNNKEWEHAINQESRETLDDLMNTYGWNREIETIDVTYHPRTGPILNNYLCKANRLTCNCDGKSSLIYLTRMPTSVIMTCQYCRRNTSSVSFDMFDKLMSRRLTIKEAFQLCEDKNVMPPVGLDQAYPDRRKLKGKPRFIV